MERDENSGALETSLALTVLWQNKYKKIESDLENANIQLLEATEENS